MITSGSDTQNRVPDHCLHVFLFVSLCYKGLNSIVAIQSTLHAVSAWQTMLVLTQSPPFPRLPRSCNLFWLKVSEWHMLHLGWGGKQLRCLLHPLSHSVLPLETMVVSREVEAACSNHKEESCLEHCPAQELKVCWILPLIFQCGLAYPITMIR